MTKTPKESHRQHCIVGVVRRQRCCRALIIIIASIHYAQLTQLFIDDLLMLPLASLLITVDRLLIKMKCR